MIFDKADRLIEKLSATILLRYHYVAMIFWLMVTPITLKYPESVMWVAFMSQYANFVGHFASADAARAEKASTKQIEAMRRELRELRKYVKEKS